MCGRALTGSHSMGVGQFVKRKDVMNWLRKMVERYSVPFAKQAVLAALLLNRANLHNKGKLTLQWLKNYGYEKYIPSFVKHGDIDVDQKTGD
jgi:hypothetical protein